MAKLRAGTITLDECAQLRAWLLDVYFGEAPVPPLQRTIATLILGAVHARLAGLPPRCHWWKRLWRR